MPKIAIVNTLGSLQPVVDAFEAEILAELDSRVEFVVLSPTASSLEAGLDELIASKPDLVISLNTPNSLEVASRFEAAEIPQVFGMVTDPVRANLVGSVENPGHNRTGVGLFHVYDTLALAVRATGAHRVGVLHQPSDSASASGLAILEEAASTLGLDLVVLDVEEDSDLDHVITSVPSLGLDLLFLVGSPFATRNLGEISLVTRTWAIPTASALTVDTLPEGFMIGVAPDSSDIGHQMAQRALAILNGGTAGTIPVGIAKSVALLDLGLARRYGISVPDDAMTAFDLVLRDPR